MMVANIVLYIIIGMCFLDTILMFIFCRIAEKMDKIYFRKREQQDTLINNLGESEVEAIQTKAHKIKVFLVRIYNWGYSYLYGLMRYNLIMVGKIPSHKIRHFLYKFVYCMKLDKYSVIYGGCEIRSPWNITIGNAVIAVGCLLDGRERIIIGNNVVFGSGVHLWTEEHDLNDPLFRVTPAHSQPIVVEDYAWVCSDSTILPGTHIGKGAVVASRACVTRDCEAYGVYGGVPAKKISVRNQDLRYELNGKPTWHFY